MFSEARVNAKKIAVRASTYRIGRGLANDAPAERKHG